MKCGLLVALVIVSCGPPSDDDGSGGPGGGGGEGPGGGDTGSACEIAQRKRSNVGCEYWAVDLDNEYSRYNDAAGEPFAVALANSSASAVDVVIDQNDGEPGQPPILRTVMTTQIPAESLVTLELPRREVDGSLAGMDEGPGTMLSSRAYRIQTSLPVVAYQFNPIIQSYSNGASLLIPTSGLDDHYWVLGWPTANPIGISVPGFPSEPGIPDHSFVTIVGVDEAPVHVEVALGGAIVAGGPMAATPAGQSVTADLGAFDVLNLESDGVPGDLSGTTIFASGPVAVFSGGERAIVPYDVQPPPPPGYDESQLCCTEHFEQQLFPTTALGKSFVVTRSPPRSSNVASPEADVYRILATEAGTTVTTNLPPPYDVFTVEPGRFHELWAQRDFVVEASAPVVLGQYLVSQGYVESPDVGGDPEFILFPPAEQHRDEYLFLAPATFERDWVVIAAPEAASVTLDGMPVNAELDPLCARFPVGDHQGIAYVAIRCPLSDGVHHLTADQAVGATVYGYYNVGSYGYPAGSELTRINLD